MWSVHLYTKWKVSILEIQKDLRSPIDLTHAAHGIAAAISTTAQPERRSSGVIIHSERDISLSEQAGIPFCGAMMLTQVRISQTFSACLTHNLSQLWDNLR